MAEENFATADDGEEPSASQLGQRPISALRVHHHVSRVTAVFHVSDLSPLTERSNLGSVKSNQDGALQEAQKVQSQFLFVGQQDRRTCRPGAMPAPR
jgi:hypothetical protein